MTELQQLLQEAGAGEAGSRPVGQVVRLGVDMTEQILVADRSATVAWADELLALAAHADLRWPRGPAEAGVFAGQAKLLEQE